MNNTLNVTIADMEQFLAKIFQISLQPFIGLSIGLFFSCLAMVANFIVFVIISKKKQQRTPFDLVIASLSITDFSASACNLIFAAYKVGIIFLNSNEFEKHFYFQNNIAWDISIMFFYLSLMHVLLVTFLRLFAIFWPMKFRQFATKAFIKALIAATWTLSVVAGFTIVMIKDRSFVVGIIIFASGGLVCCVYALIAAKIYILSKNSQAARNKEHRVLLNSFGVAITFFGCMLPYACMATNVKVFQHVHRYLAVSFISINFVADPLLYFYFSYWLSKRDEMRRTRNNAVPVQSHNEVLSDEHYV